MVFMARWRQLHFHPVGLPRISYAMENRIQMAIDTIENLIDALKE
jgi:hypothetical protein